MVSAIIAVLLILGMQGISVEVPDSEVTVFSNNLHLNVTITNLNSVTVKTHIAFGLTPEAWNPFPPNVYRFSIDPKEINVTLSPMKSKTIRLDITIGTKYPVWILRYRIGDGSWIRLCRIIIKNVLPKKISNIGKIYELSALFYLIFEIIILVKRRGWIRRGT